MNRLLTELLLARGTGDFVKAFLLNLVDIEMYIFFLSFVSQMLLSIVIGLSSLVIPHSLNPAASHPALPKSTAVKTTRIIPVIVSVCGLLF